MSASNSSSSVTDVKKNNIISAKLALKEARTASKQELAGMTGLSVSTCNTVLNQLNELNIVTVVMEKPGSSAGRPAKYYCLNKDYIYELCANIGYDQERASACIHYQVLDFLGSVLFEQTCYITNMDYGFLESTIDQALLLYPKIGIIFISMPGFFANTIWTSVRSKSFMKLNGLNIADLLFRHTQIKVLVENDLNALSYGIYHADIFHVKEYSSLAVIAFLSTGTGSGIIYRGDIVHGHDNFAGEIGCLPFEEDLDMSIRRNHESMIRCAAQTIDAINAIINPASVILVGDYFDDNSVREILDADHRKIEKSQLPHLYYLKDYESYFLTGLYRIALDYIIQND